MTLTPGTRLGPYEIIAQIGVGGMGEVYRATDINLRRSVAIKVLPASFSGDAERLARFRREAEVLASLNHPNIAQIHGLETSDGITALVMELVEGEELSHCIAHGAMPIDETLPIATQIAEALEAAHEQNIIHRDLKPANIKVRAHGQVKVLDFGLAKANPWMRLRDIGEARVEIDKVIAGAGDDPGAPQTTTSTTSAEPRGRLPWLAFAVAVIGMAALAVPAVRYLSQTSPPAPLETRVEIVTPPSAQPASFALSPDGRQIVEWRRIPPVAAVAGDDDGVAIGWHALSLLGTGQPIRGLLRRERPEATRTSGGAPRTLAPALGGGSGGTWNADGVIVMAAVWTHNRVGSTTWPPTGDSSSPRCWTTPPPITLIQNWNPETKK